MSSFPVITRLIRHFRVVFKDQPFVSLWFFLILIPFYINFSGCTENVFFDKNVSEPPSGPLNIFIPNISSNSIFNQSEVSTEPIPSDADINNLYLLAVASNNPENLQIFDLKNFHYDISADSKYKIYQIATLAPGQYKFYILANIDDYFAEGVSALNSGEEVEKILLNFATESNGFKLTSGNLPMAALPRDMKISTDASSLQDETIEISDEKETHIYADLTFLCSKVRYTILFNNSPGGISESFGDYTIDFPVSEISIFATNIRQFTALDNRIECKKDFILNDGEIFRLPLTLNKYAYPKEGDDYGKDGETEYQDLTENYSPLVSSTQIAWQGTVYVPENIITNESDKTTLHFSGLILDSEGNTIDSETYADRTMAINDKIEQPGNLRGRFYDLVARITTPFQNDFDLSISISDWTIQQLSYTLEGPYELVVGATSIPSMTSGEWTTFGFFSDSEVYFDFPKLGDKDFYIYQPIDVSTLDSTGNPYEFTDGFKSHVRLMINPEISYETLKALSPEEINNYEYFYICVGNLRKKVQVESLNFSLYLTASPQNILIDLKDYLEKGMSEGKYEIDFSSNYNGCITLSCATGSDLLNPSNPLILSMENGETVKEGELTIKGGKLILNFNRLFDGLPYWRRLQSYTIIFEAGELRQIVDISVKPLVADYTIHFKEKSGEWTNPHIYVFQPLFLPDNLIGSNGVYSGKPVGYVNDGVVVPAYEYIFTSNISFRGWAGYGGPEINDLNASKELREGYVVFIDEPNYAPYEGSPRYDFNFNLNASHEADTGNMRYTSSPGIEMYPEDDEWWTYTLSGIAVPGKTKIIFYEGNSLDADTPTFPVEGEAIPLFDFVSHEGWLLAGVGENLVFTEQKPDESESGGDVNPNARYRFYWPYSKDNTIRLWTQEGETIHEFSGGVTVSGAFDPSIGEPSKGFYFYELPEYLPGTICYEINGAKVYTDLTMQDFGRKGETDFYYVHVDFAGQVYPGKPESIWTGNPSKSFYYLRRGSNNYNLEENLNLTRLYYDGGGSIQIYRTSTISLEAGEKIRISDDYDDDFLFGSSTLSQSVSNNEVFLLTRYTKNSFIIEEDFIGKAYVYSIQDNNFYLMLVPD